MWSISRSLSKSCDQPLHLHPGPAAHRFRIADQRVQPRRRHVFGGIHRQVEIAADIGRAAAVQFVTGQALRDVESLTGAGGIVRGKPLIDGKRGPARGRRKLAPKLPKLIGPILAADARRLGLGPHDVERPGGIVLASHLGPRAIRRLDRDPGNRFARVRVEHQVERDLRGEAVDGDRLDHASRRKGEASRAAPRRAPRGRSWARRR